jgi:hypothetical protein
MGAMPGRGIKTVLAGLGLLAGLAGACAQDVGRAGGLLALREQSLYLAADVAASMYARADLCGWQTADAERSFEREVGALTRDPGLTARLKSHMAERRGALRPVLATRYAHLLPCARGDLQSWRMSVMDLTARLVENE